MLLLLAHNFSEAFCFILLLCLIGSDRPLDGTALANHKFCMTCHARLSLSYSAVARILTGCCQTDDAAAPNIPSCWDHSARRKR